MTTPYLYPSFHSGALHSGRNVDGVTPDVVIKFGSPYDPGCDVTKVEPDPQDEVELDEGLVEVGDGPLELEDEFQHFSQVLILVGVLVPDVRIHPGCCHERRTDRFDLFHVPEFCPIQDFVEIGNEFVQNSEIFFSSHVGLVVELVEVDQAGEDDADLSVVLRILRRFFQRLGHVSRNDVV